MRGLQEVGAQVLEAFLNGVWLIENGHPDFGWTNYEGKSLMALARETPNKDMINLLREHGAV